MFDSFQNILMFIGAATVLVFLFCILCLAGFLSLIGWDRYVEHRKSDSARHKSAGSVIPLPTNEDLDFFYELSKTAAADEKKSQENLDALRKKLAEPAPDVPGSSWDHQFTNPNEAGYSSTSAAMANAVKYNDTGLPQSIHEYAGCEPAALANAFDDETRVERYSFNMQGKGVQDVISVNQPR